MEPFPLPRATYVSRFSPLDPRNRASTRAAIAWSLRVSLHSFAACGKCSSAASRRNALYQKPAHELDQVSSVGPSSGSGHFLRPGRRHSFASRSTRFLIPVTPSCARGSWLGTIMPSSTVPSGFGTHRFSTPPANTLAFSETMFGNLWITAPVQYCFGNPVFAANVLILASFVLTAYCTYLLVRRLTRSRWAGIVAGCLFSFNPWRWSDAAHLQLLAVFWLPIAFLFCHRFLETRRLRDGLLTVFALVAQSYTSVYLGFLLQIRPIVLSAMLVGTQPRT
ncbi:MAG: hypothetical protein KatS3mg105_1398 [Gemmatales bacterium]|nr:MAG: hypothetical protein KatS3mg105_1398 [Gemmatales bacterium]